MPNTPFDRVIKAIKSAGYHNHRREIHSNQVGEGIFEDLTKTCPSFEDDVENGLVRKWINVNAPGDRERNIDLFVGEPASKNAPVPVPSLNLVRFCVENKSVITAHRNRTNRFDDLLKVMKTMHAARSEVVLVATVLVGMADRFLNVADKITPMFRKQPAQFNARVLPRLSTGDESLWDDFDYAISLNTENDIYQTIERFRALPLRRPGFTHEIGFDFVLLVPVLIDNVNPPRLARRNKFGLDFDHDYNLMITTICAAYTARWHSSRLVRS